MLDGTQIKQEINCCKAQSGSEEEDGETIHPSTQGAEGVNPPLGGEPPSRIGGTDWCRLCIVGLLLLLGLEEAMLLL